MPAHTFLGFFEHECVATEDGGHEDLELQGRQVLTNTCPTIRADHLVSLSEKYRRVTVSLTLDRTRTD